MNKYNAQAVEVDGIRFASKAEAKRYGQLKLLEMAGYIRDIVLQPKFPIEIKGKKVGSYAADFSYFDRITGKRTYEDVKGVKTPVYKLKKKLVEALYDITITEVTRP